MLRRARAAVLAAAVAMSGGVGLADVKAGATSSASAAESALAGARYIVGRQTPNGSFFESEAPTDQVAEALTASLAAGPGGTHVTGALDRIAAAGPARAAERPAYAARIVLALLAAGEHPSAFRGTDYVALSARGYNPATGAYDSGLYANALAIAGAHALDERLPEPAVRYLAANRCPDGGWSWQEACLQRRSETDTTAVTLVALRTAGLDASHDLVRGGLAWLAGARRPSGGFGIAAGDPVNANSTGLALLAIHATGQDPGEPPWTSPDGRGPVNDLVSLQRASGDFVYTAGGKPSDYATVQAVLGLSGRALPFRASASSAPPAAATPPATRAEAARAAASAAASGATASPDGAAATRTVAGRAGVLVVDGTAEPRRFCPLVEDGDTGVDLLERTGVELTVNVSSLGTTVCKIDGKGCEAGNCFCAFPDFWRYYTRSRGEPWAFSEVGAHERKPSEGTLDAWVWGGDAAPPPPAEETFETVCADDVAEPAATERAAGAGDGEQAGGFSSGALVAVAAVLLSAIVVLVASRRRDGPPADASH